MDRKKISDIEFRRLQALKDVTRKHKAYDNYTMRSFFPVGGVSSTNFNGQTHVFNISTGPNEFLLRDEARVRVRVKIGSTANFTAFSDVDGIAFSQNPGAAFFDDEEIKINGTVIDHIPNHNTRINTIVNRISNDSQYFENSVEYWDCFEDRLEKTVRNNNTIGYPEKKSIINLREIDDALEVTLAVAADVDDVSLRILTFQYTGHANANAKIAPLLRIGSPISLSVALAVRYIGKVYNITSATPPVIYVIDDGQVAIAANTVLTSAFTTFPSKVKNLVRIADNTYDIYYKPSSTFFREKRARCFGKSTISYQLKIHNEATIGEYLIESKSSVVLNTDFYFQVQDMQLYIPSVKKNVMYKDRSEFLDMRTFSLIQKNKNKSNSQEQFMIPPKTTAVIICWQDTTQTSIKSRMKMEVEDNRIQLKLRKFQAKLNGKLIPEKQYSFGTSTTDNSIRLIFNDNNHYMLSSLFDVNESFDDFLERGIFFYLPFKNDSKVSEQMDVEYSLTRNDGVYDIAATNVRMIAIPVRRSLIELKIRNHIISEVITRNI